MKKVIKLKEYNIENIDVLKPFGLNIIESFKTKDSVAYEPYDGIILKNETRIIFPEGRENLRLLSNDVELEGLTPDKESEVVLEIDDNSVEEGIPEFGLSTDLNINSCQINIPLEKIKQLFSFFFWWDMDGLFHYNGRSFPKDKLERETLTIQRYGCSYPLIIYIDEIIKTYLSEFTIYICDLIGKNKVPCRVLCYKDIKYIESLDEDIYNLIKKLPSNKFYHVEDNIDVLPHMITNYSDKRAVIAKYSNTEISSDILKNIPDGMYIKFFPMINYKVILPYIFDETMEAKNEEMLTRVKNKNYPPISYGRMDEIVNISLGRELSAYMNGYAYACNIEYYGEERDLDEYEGYIISGDELDLGKFNITNFNYSRSTRIVSAHGLHKLQADFIIPMDEPLCLSGLCLATNDTFNKDNLIIKIGSKKD